MRKGKPKQTSPEPEYPPELRSLIDRGMQGDQSVATELRAILPKHPELVKQFGDTASLARNCLLNLAAEDNVLAREIFEKGAEDLRERLLAEAPSELEKLLVDRIVLCSLHVNICEVQCATTQSAGAVLTAREATRRLDQANNRFLAACRSLALVRKLLKRVPGPFDLTIREVREVPEPEKKPTATAKSTIPKPRMPAAMSMGAQVAVPN